MAEEFDESEVLFSDDFSSVLKRDEENENLMFGFKERKKTRRIIKRTEKASLSSSLPVNIPENMFRRYVGKEDDDEYTDEEYSDEGREIVPPHIIVGRRIQGGQVAFSVCTGSGRTLKGRDLSRVRNSVLRLTGFLEA
ncbi:hypothetical protein EUTSA_v10017404mg [Eutrema salsugineum]|uniref:Senescence regulator S40 n=1 Tax=Eutrema salsugineum TaxID=72664 RepID=V4LNC4_EUTSA|nr:uncharacterized protein LOC18027004 [Eutrema salsugineum]ESQ52030.1 hypothetical protein EUTSA_v10017404mg [Eutrema salsugineum]